jgi:outer membrane receptor protein involved in Fe transport
VDARNSVKLIWGQSYRAPSLFELYFQTPQNTVYGNLALEPETGDTLELAYVTSFRGVFVQALAYHARYDRRIARVPRYPRLVSDPRDTSTAYVNGERFSAHGLELELRLDRPRLASAFVSVDYVHGESGGAPDGSDRDNFRYVPRLSLSAGLARSLGPLSFSAVVNHASSSRGTRGGVPGHTTLDASLSCGHGRGRARLQHSLYVKNAFDEAVLAPEYVRGLLGEVPVSLGRRVGYRLSLRF